MRHARRHTRLGDETRFVEKILARLLLAQFKLLAQSNLHSIADGDLCFWGARGNKKERVPEGPTLNDQPSENGSYEKLLKPLYAFRPK